MQRNCFIMFHQLAKCPFFLFFGLYCKNSVSLFLFAGSMATERGKWLNHFGKRYQSDQMSLSLVWGPFFQQTSTTTTLWLRPHEFSNTLVIIKIKKVRCNPALRRNRGKVAYF